MFEPFQVALGRVAGDDRGDDGTYRDAAHPVRLNTGLGQGLVAADMVRAQGTTALKDQGDLRFLGEQ